MKSTIEKDLESAKSEAGPRGTNDMPGRL
jgi:hypothetical protein